jgi:hypothetical protein
MKKIIIMIMFLVTSLLAQNIGTTTTPFDTSGWDDPAGYSEYYHFYYFRLLSHPGGRINLNTEKMDSLFNEFIIFIDSTQLVIEDDTLRFADDFIEYIISATAGTVAFGMVKDSVIALVSDTARAVIEEVTDMIGSGESFIRGYASIKLAPNDPDTITFTSQDIFYISKDMVAGILENCIATDSSITVLANGIYDIEYSATVYVIGTATFDISCNLFLDDAKALSAGFVETMADNTCKYSVSFTEQAALTSGQTVEIKYASSADSKQIAIAPASFKITKIDEYTE